VLSPLETVPYSVPSSFEPLQAGTGCLALGVEYRNAKPVPWTEESLENVMNTLSEATVNKAGKMLPLNVYNGAVESSEPEYTLTKSLLLSRSSFVNWNVIPRTSPVVMTPLDGEIRQEHFCADSYVAATYGL